MFFIRRVLPILLLPWLVSCMEDTAGAPPTIDQGLTSDRGLPTVLDALTVSVDQGVDAAMPNADYSPCEANEQCVSGYCVPSPDGQRVCTELCRDDDDCPDGWACSPVANTRPDTVFICIARRQVQCLSCTQDSDCGSGQDRCAPLGRSLRCLTDCSDTECPDGSRCDDVEVDGVDVPLCVPESGVCADCVDLDGDGYGNQGDCPANDCNDDNETIFPGAPERCDGLDNDCDSQTDENISIGPDDNTCSAVGICADVAPLCGGGAWQCDYGELYDEDTESRCDGLDNDCDDAIDEDFDFAVDPAHCGGCNQACMLPNAEPSCSNGQCAADRCQDGFHNVDGIDLNGCEYGPCLPSANGEVCDGLDNDCDGLADEGFADQVDEPDQDGLDSNCDGIDGDISRSLFVAPNGDDRNNGLTPDSPLATIGRAMRLATALPGRDRVLVQSGLYRSDETITLVSGTSIFAGYGAGFGVRDEQRATLIINATPAIRGISLNAPTRLERFDFEGVDQSDVDQTAIGLTLENSGNFLTLTESSIRSGDGADGQAGDNGLDGRPGSDGINGQGRNGGQAGEAGGGAGATGRRRAVGLAGEAGQANGSECGGASGSASGNGGMGCGDGDPRRGGNGGNGCPGQVGLAGSIGQPLGALDGISYRPVHGGPGGDGGNGGGGGGGGAGGGENCTVLGICSACGTGRGGGGGGGGGNGGTGGTGGQTGGASIGAILINSQLTLNGSTIRAGDGGAGAPGGISGRGGDGGQGGAGVTTGDDTQGNGGNGGDGGPGGDGGCGGPGSGGASIGVWATDDASLVLDDASSVGAGASGGGARNCGIIALPGQRDDTRGL